MLQKDNRGQKASSTGLQKHVHGFISFVKILNNNDVYFIFTHLINEIVRKVKASVFLDESIIFSFHVFSSSIYLL